MVLWLCLKVFALLSNNYTVRHPESSKIIPINGLLVSNEESFHRVFAEAFGFTGFYGENWNAWIYSIPCHDGLEAGLSSVHVRPEELMLISLSYSSDFKASFPRSDSHSWSVSHSLIGVSRSEKRHRFWIYLRMNQHEKKMPNESRISVRHPVDGL